MAASAPASLPATGSGAGGSLAIRAIQGTKGGPAVTGDHVLVTLYSQGEPMREVDTHLDATGVLVLEDLPLVQPLQAEIAISHGGADYEEVSPVLDAAHPQQIVDVTVYETTDQAPAWEVRMRHVMVQPTPQGLQVMEMLAIHNPSDHAWLAPPDSEGVRASLRLPLPPGAREVELAGAFRPCCDRISDTEVTHIHPLAPGLSQFRLAYVVPAHEGKARLAIIAPALVRNQMLFLPEDAQDATVEGLASLGVLQMAQAHMQTFKGQDLPAGQRTMLLVPHLPAAPVVGAAPSASRWPRWLAIGGGVLLAGLCLVVWFKPRTRRREAPGSEGRRAVTCPTTHPGPLPAACDAPSPAVRAQGLCQSFDGRYALREVDLEIAPGSRVALVGANGAGKSTLLRILSLLSAPSAGRLQLFGQPAAPVRRRPRLRRRLGLIAHQPMLYRDLTVRENLAFFAGLYGLRQAAGADRRAAGAGGHAPARRAARADAQPRHGAAGGHRPGPGPRPGPAAGGRTIRRPGRPLQPGPAIAAE